MFASVITPVYSHQIRRANESFVTQRFQLLVLKYVQNKDVFMRYHKAHLTRRLILDISADSEIEENMVEWLRVRVLEPAQDNRW